jgi:hypothetical protein
VVARQADTHHGRVVLGQGFNPAPRLIARAIIHQDQFIAEANDLPAGLGHAPMQLGKAVLFIETWDDNRKEYEPFEIFVHCS